MSDPNQEREAAEHALDLCNRAAIPEHRTRILLIQAHDAAESERSVHFKFSEGESAAIFAAAAAVLSERLGRAVGTSADTDL